MEKIKTLELFGGVGTPRSALENLNYFDIKAEDDDSTIKELKKIGVEIK